MDMGQVTSGYDNKLGIINAIKFSWEENEKDYGIADD
jgi:hypothetical protein